MTEPLAAVDFETPIRDGFTTVATFVPKLLGFLIILGVGYLIAKFVAKLVDRLLERAGFDRAVEKGGLKKALDRSSFDASDIVAKLVFFAIFVPVLSAAIGVLGIAALQQPLAAFIALIPNIIVAVILIVLGAVIAGAVKNLIESALGGLSYGKALATIASLLILLGFVKSALDQVGVATTVTGPLLYAILGTVAGVVIVGAGGGLIRPMQHRWETWLNKAEDESSRIKAEATSNAPAYPSETGSQDYAAASSDPTPAPAGDPSTQDYATPSGHSSAAPYTAASTDEAPTQTFGTPR